MIVLSFCGIFTLVVALLQHADQMTTTGVGNGIEDEPGSMAVEPEWRLDRQGDSADQSYPSYLRYPCQLS